jgi:hypothetical protein
VLIFYSPFTTQTPHRHESGLNNMLSVPHHKIMAGRVVKLRAPSRKCSRNKTNLDRAAAEFLKIEAGSLVDYSAHLSRM